LIVDRIFDRFTLESGITVGILLKNVKNPYKSLSEELIRKEFRISTMTPDEYPIDRAKDLDFTIGCIYPCMSCDQEATICTSCQMLNEFQRLHLYE